jgi:malate dehydrogenase (oxaloacetate-decarboxylating)(NADP+)
MTGNPAKSRGDFPTGVALLHDPALNKGTGFTERERDALALQGLLPPTVASQDEQVDRILENMRRLPSDLDKYVLLQALRNRNETLFIRVVTDYPDEMMPIIYTPTVGLACQRYGHIYQQSSGMFISANHRGRIARVLRNWPRRDVAIIVVTDGERILGLGDLGANGMGIPVGKLSLYTACAGIDPVRCLPVILDVGTNNASFLADPLYLGLKRRRIAGSEYDAFLDEFIAATQQVFPGVLIQIEDFATQNAFRLLRDYRERICAFNDDIQGTAAVALAGILSALRINGSRITDQKVLFLGAGEAAIGISDLLSSAMAMEGLRDQEARRRCWLFDSRGLVVKSRTDLAAHKLPYAHEHAPIGDFVTAVKMIRPTAIIGVAAVGGMFTEEVVRAMAEINRQPIIFALSNPTSQSECTADEAYRWTEGRALFASGSPFDPVTVKGKTLVARQGNNSYIFPGVGLGAIASGARHVTDEMFFAAARALAAQVSDQDLSQGSLFPPLAHIREVSAAIASAVAEVAYARNLAARPRPADLGGHIRAQMYDPHYRSYV